MGTAGLAVLAIIGTPCSAIGEGEGNCAWGRKCGLQFRLESLDTQVMPLYRALCVARETNASGYTAPPNPCKQLWWEEGRKGVARSAVLADQ